MRIDFQDDVVFHLNKLLTSPPEDKNKITIDEQMARDYYYSKSNTHVNKITNNHIRYV